MSTSSQTRTHHLRRRWQDRPHVARTFAREAPPSSSPAGRERPSTRWPRRSRAGGAPRTWPCRRLDDAAVAPTSRKSSSRWAEWTCASTSSRAGRPGYPAADMDVDDSCSPFGRARSNFITGRAAARHMVGQGSGVILMITSGSGTVLKPSPDFQMGGTGPADAARSRSCTTWRARSAHVACGGRAVDGRSVLPRPDGAPVHARPRPDRGSNSPTPPRLWPLIVAAE